MCVLQSQQESVRTHLGRIVTVMWLLLMIIFNSSYTASLATLLSAEQRFPTIDNFEVLRKNTTIPIGYQQGSFLVDYLKNTQLKGHEFRGFASAEEFEQAFRKGPHSPEGIGAVLDELAFLQLLLAANCDLTIASAGDDILSAFGGFAFAFQKGDALVDKISMMILELLADDTVQRLQNAWKLGSDASNKCGSNNRVHVLTLRSFGGLFGILAVLYLICLTCRALTKTILPLLKLPLFCGIWGVPWALVPFSCTFLFLFNSSPGE
ncbi:hypothetical protein KP509_1Z216900 [Ceratopteris richardii]|nr:hypothetical protein KP509_1Z216900 [Ceratopteris richardii]